MRQPKPRRGLKCILAVAAAVISTTAAGQSRAMSGADPKLSGVYRTAPVASVAGVRFTVATDGPIRSSPAVAGGLLVFGSDDGFLHAVDALSGAERWRFRTGGAVRSSPAIVGGSVYFASRDGRLYALAAATGRLRWKLAFARDLGDQNYWDYYLSSPTLADGILYAGSGDGHLYAVDAARGRVVWKHDVGSRIRATPAVDGGLVVFGTMSGHVYALDRRTGAERWKFATRGASRSFADKHNDTTSVFASPSIGSGIVTIGGRDGYLYGLDLATGRQRWDATQDGGSWILSTAIDGGTVYVGGGSAFLVQALDLATGKEKWRFHTHGAVFSRISIAGGLLYFSDFSGFLYAVDAASGQERWHFLLGDRGLATPVPAAGIVYAASDAGILYALQGGPARPNATTVRRAVYWQGKKNDEDFAWFANGADLAILNFFKAAGYEQVNADQLGTLLADQARDGTRSVVVFADGRMPQKLAEQDPQSSLFRRYLDQGGKAVFLGIDPLSLHYDHERGTIDRIDDAYAGKVLGLTFPPRNIGTGFYTSRPTAEGRRWGLSGFFVGTGVIDPRQPVTVLAKDEFGMASAWAKNYGGPEGTGLLQLSVPRAVVIDYAPILAAAEHGLR